MLLSCRRQDPPPAPATWRLVDHLSASQAVVRRGRLAEPAHVWEFDNSDQPFTVVRDAEQVRVAEGVLRGMTTGPRALIAIPAKELSSGEEDKGERVWGVELRGRISSGTSMGVQVSTGSESSEDFKLLAVTPVARTNEMVTYRLPADEVALGFRGPRSRITWIGIMPTNAPGATFEIDSLRFITKEEILGEIAEGPGRFGLEGVWYDAVATWAPSVLKSPVAVPSNARLSLSVGTPESKTVKFQVFARTEGRREELLACNVRPEGGQRQRGPESRWQYLEADLQPYAGKEIELELVTECRTGPSLAYWGNVTVASGDRDPRPNVLVYMIDTLRQDRLSAYGYARDTSPRIDDFARDGVVFEAAVAQSTWTKISVTSLFSSLYPSEHGVLRWGQKLPESVATFAERLRQGGYSTFGASTNPFIGNDSNLQQGFDVFYESYGISKEYKAGPGESLQDDGNADIMNRLLEDWLPRLAQGRFFIYAHVTDPHAPYSPGDELASLWRPGFRADLKRQQEWNEKLRPLIPAGFHRRGALPQTEDLDTLGIPHDEYISFYSDMYDAEVRQVDIEFGRLLDQLEHLGLAENTLVILVSDHGEQFFEHGGTGHSDNVFAETARVPLIMRWPKGLQRGQRNSDVVGLIDVVPTTLELLGLGPVPMVSGKSWAAALSLTDTMAGVRTRRVGGQGTDLSAARGIFTERHPAPDQEPGTAFARHQIAVTFPRWRGIENLAPFEGEPDFALYDWTIDPFDQRNVASDYPEIAAKVRSLLLDWYQNVERRPDPRAAPNDAEMPGEQLEHLRSLGYIE